MSSHLLLTPEDAATLTRVLDRAGVPKWRSKRVAWCRNPGGGER